MKIKIKRKLKEMSSMGGGAVQGYAGSPLASKEENEKFNKKQEEEQRLKGQKLAEMYSTQGLSGRNKQQLVSGEEEHEGHVERSKHQGLKNVMEADDETATMDMDPRVNKPTELSNFGSNLQDLSPTARKAVTDAGYKFVDYLGGGQFGKVFKVKNPATNRDEAMKIVMGTPNSVNREVRNYDLVQRARKKSPIIAKHFPETYASWQQDGFGYIAMEILEPVKYADAAMVVDRTHILSTKAKGDQLLDKEGEKGSEVYSHYRDQSKKAAFWFTNSFVDSLRGASADIESKALAGSLSNLPEMDFSDLLMEISPAAMLGLKAQMDTGNINFSDNIDEHINFFVNNKKDLPLSSRLVSIVLSEVPDAPHVAVAIAKIGNVALNIRGRGQQAIGYNNLNMRDLDRAAYRVMLPYVKGYREFSTMRIGYDKKGPQVSTGTEKESWDKIAKELYDLTGLAPRDVHYGNVMQRPSGDLVIVDLGLFKNKTDSAGMFESKKYKLKILRK
jgi:serine/threonine protein kinase